MVERADASESARLRGGVVGGVVARIQSSSDLRDSSSEPSEYREDQDRREER